MEKEVATSIERARARVAVKTHIQDMTEPLTGQVDARRVAARITNVESAVGELADAVETLGADRDAGEPVGTEAPISVPRE